MLRIRFQPSMRPLLRHSLRHWRALAGAFALATFHHLLIFADTQIVRLSRGGLYARMSREQSEVAEAVRQP
jgi:hypothetical protein